MMENKPSGCVETQNQTDWAIKAIVSPFIKIPAGEEYNKLVGYYNLIHNYCNSVQIYCIQLCLRH